MSTSSTASRLRLIPIVLAQATGLACGLASVKLNSHYVPPALLGRYGIFLTLAPLGMWVVHAGLIKFAGRHWAGAANRPALARALLTGWARRLPWLALAAGVAATLAVSGSPGDYALFGLLLFVAAALLALGALAQAALQAERAHWPDCFVAASGSLTRSFLPPLLFVATGGTLTALWLGYGLHTLILALAGGWALRRSWPTAAASPEPAQLTAVYEGPLFLALALAGWILTGLPRWLVLGFFGETEAGYFTLGGGAALIAPTLIATALMQYAQPGFFALGDTQPAQPRALARRVDQVALTFVALASLGVVAVDALAPRLIGSLISPAYRDALPWLLPAGAFGIAMLTAIFYHSLLLAAHRERACGPVDLTTAGILAGGCGLAAWQGQSALMTWLLISPLVPWIITRPLARHYLFRPDATPAPAPGR